MCDGSVVHYGFVHAYVGHRGLFFFLFHVDTALYLHLFPHNHTRGRDPFGGNHLDVYENVHHCHYDPYIDRETLTEGVFHSNL